MEKTRYTNEPEPVLVDRHAGHIKITVSANVQKIADEPEQWEADTHTFWELEDEIDLDDVIAQPAAYLNYMTVDTRRGARQQAQGMLDKLRNGDFVVPVPSYREGARVCNRSHDQSKIAILLAMGEGADVFELEDGEIVSLTHAELQAIVRDGKAAEMSLQMAKQACWDAIEQAGTFEEITAALATFEGVLEQYTPAK